MSSTNEHGAFILRSDLGGPQLIFWRIKSGYCSPVWIGTAAECCGLCSSGAICEDGFCLGFGGEVATDMSVFCHHVKLVKVL